MNPKMEKILKRMDVARRSQKRIDESKERCITVGQLKELLSNYPDDLPVVTGDGRMFEADINTYVPAIGVGKFHVRYSYEGLISCWHGVEAPNMQVLALDGYGQE